MTDKDALFLLAKVNVIQHLCTSQIAMFAIVTGKMGRNDPNDFVDTMEHNLRGLIQFHARVEEGDTTRTDPTALQNEMLRQLGPIFRRIRDAVAVNQGKEPPK